MFDRALVGRTSPVREVVLDRAVMMQFARAIGSTDPLHFDRDAARAAGHPDILAAPTFAYCLESLSPGLTYADLGVPAAELLHAEQRFVCHRPLYAGDTVRLRTRVADVFARKAGALQFVSLETSLTTTDGVVAVVSTALFVVRR
jgi:acyl dehydratase